MAEAIVLDGFLDEETLPGRDGCTARFRLTLSPTDDPVDEGMLPCTVADPELAQWALRDLIPGTHLRVTGYLHVPSAPDDHLRLHVATIEVLAPAPGTVLAAGLEALAEIGLPDDGFIDRFGPYLTFHDPVGVASVWTTTGAWVGQADYNPDTVSDVIFAFERDTAAGGE
ncbi:hypothetical protein AB0451_34610 [Streptomyces sp. NPDC052000]|uniref:hypothetical protein n=1 Tax=Streptomyces sp. NPDC052000 TaxID=3155676 RepID=UPI00344E7C6B